MSKNRMHILVDINKYVIFRDIENKEKTYAITKEEKEKINSIIRDFDNRESNAPDEYTVKAFPLEKVGEKDMFTDEYNIVQNESIEFKINKISWLGMALI